MTTPALQCIGLHPFLNPSELMTTYCSHINFMIYRTSYRNDKQTNRHKCNHQWHQVGLVVVVVSGMQL